MSNINKQVEEYVQSEKRKNITIGVVVILPIVAALLFFIMPNMGDTSQVSGVVTRLIGKENAEYGPTLYLSVRLDSGEMVRSRIGGSGFYRKGKRVNLDKVEPLTFGNPTYIFRGYEEGE